MNSSLTKRSENIKHLSPILKHSTSTENNAINYYDTTNNASSFPSSANNIFSNNTNPKQNFTERKNEKNRLIFKEQKEFNYIENSNEKAIDYFKKIIKNNDKNRNSNFVSKLRKKVDNLSKLNNNLSSEQLPFYQNSPMPIHKNKTKPFDFNPQIIKEKEIISESNINEKKSEFEIKLDLNLEKNDNIMDLDISYIIKTRPGSLPGVEFKKNQDIACVTENFANEKENYLFTVCDGHGHNGHFVSGFLKTNLNSDSRAMICRQGINKRWQAYALSIDQKPDNNFEKLRILSCGGRVEPFKSQYGDSIGPARVWLKFQQMPGLAMSRSFGDCIAKQVGVTADPEITSFTLSEEDKFIVVASDGVWEFLSNTKKALEIKSYKKLLLLGKK